MPCKGGVPISLASTTSSWELFPEGEGSAPDRLPERLPSVTNPPTSVMVYVISTHQTPNLSQESKLTPYKLGLRLPVKQNQPVSPWNMKFVTWIQILTPQAVWNVKIVSHCKVRVHRQVMKTVKSLTLKEFLVPAVTPPSTKGGQTGL